MKYFLENGWDVTGVDFSSHGCRTHNPHLISSFVEEDIYSYLKKTKTKFDVVLMNNVLEHVISPKEVLEDLKDILTESGILIINVPNDFSSLQRELIEKGYINSEFWVCTPDHLNYFSHESLTNLLEDRGFRVDFLMSGLPIDFDLFVDETNYIKSPNKGKSSHLKRVRIENFLSKISITKKVYYKQMLANLGVGRDVIAFASCRK